MNTLIHLSSKPEKGRCVVASRNIKAGTILEMAPVVPFGVSGNWREHKLAEYAFAWEDGEYVEAVAFGLISFCSHSGKPTAKWFRHWGDKTISLVAVVDLKEGDEVTISYGSKVWFEVKE